MLDYIQLNKYRDYLYRHNIIDNTQVTTASGITIGIYYLERSGTPVTFNDLTAQEKLDVIQELTDNKLKDYTHMIGSVASQDLKYFQTF